jgi:hypothetical protein
VEEEEDGSSGERAREAGVCGEEKGVEARIREGELARDNGDRVRREEEAERVAVAWVEEWSSRCGFDDTR